MHIYAFGSICRGDVDRESDVDLLAIVSKTDNRFDPSKFSIYSYAKIAKMWNEGNPFAWHLHLESRLLFASDGMDTIRELARPAPYERYVTDCEKFREVFEQAAESLKSGPGSRVFDLSSAFVGLRNIATCFSLGVRGVPNFSRNVARQMGTESVPISEGAYCTLERARILCTRSSGPDITREEAEMASKELPKVSEWMTDLVRKAKEHDRIQQPS